MDCQSSQQVVFDTETLIQLEDEIKQELICILNNSNLSRILESYGISESEVIRVNYAIDFDKLKLSDDTKIVRFLEGGIGLLKPCPVPGYPQGCWAG
ncbi:MAG: hypothetical protein KME21_21050 [Desmonostoc vinosum HA7617-LM4]|jgi:hypothetical protein|nr:hypothetical protein [Desmonostoc vinosum HA7617-LM4]